MKNVAFSLFSIFVFSCDFDGIKNESINKTEYSIVESFEYKYREISNDKP